MVCAINAGRRLVTGSHDKFMMLADIHGHVQRTWKASHVHDLAISADGQLLFCVTSERKVHFGLSLSYNGSKAAERFFVHASACSLHASLLLCPDQHAVPIR